MVSNPTISQQLEQNGYVIIDDFIAQEMIEPLREACERVIQKARSGQWTYRRLVGKQFPPWTEGDDVWGVQHLMHPDLNEPIFVQWIASDQVLNTVSALLRVKESELQLELVNLLVNPEKSNYELSWHRDMISSETLEQEEWKKLQIPHFGTQWNAALYDESCLIIVPKSHNRVRTAQERQITLESPLGEMPGQLVVHLKAGQAVFYNNNILHRAVYFKDNKRATLHASMGTIIGGSHRAQNILQHGLNWMREERFQNTLPERLRPIYDNLVRLTNKETEVTYTHKD